MFVKSLRKCGMKYVNYIFSQYINNQLVVYTYKPILLALMLYKYPFLPALCSNVKKKCGSSSQKSKRRRFKEQAASSF